ncbi:hypothetical protein FBU30_005128 [Linnemannia zychae]|nr:hypothetical protein FBU30_005128 [Linnemannia zychae]
MPFPPHKPRLSRSPTPYSLMGFEASMDSQREKQQREHTVPDNSTATSDINDYKKPTAGWTLFAQLAKMTPEEVELIRLTKANTAANKQICARPPTIDPSSPRNATESMDSSILEISGPYRTTLPNSPLLRREISVSPPPPQLPSFCKTSAREQLPSLKEHDSIDNRLSSDSDLGSPSRLTNEQRLSPPGSHASPSSLSISPCQVDTVCHATPFMGKMKNFYLPPIRYIIVRQTRSPELPPN